VRIEVAEPIEIVVLRKEKGEKGKEEFVAKERRSRFTARMRATGMLGPRACGR
jgi:hypothetical protein